MKKIIKKITEKYRKSLAGNYASFIKIDMNLVVYRINHVIYVNRVL